jgi:hypothetical protein
VNVLSRSKKNVPESGPSGLIDPPPNPPDWRQQVERWPHERRVRWRAKVDEGLAEYAPLNTVELIQASELYAYYVTDERTP